MAQIPLSLNENSADSNGIGPGGTGSGDPGPHGAGPQAPQKSPVMGWFAVGFGFLGIFTIGFVFVPLGLICSLIALLTGQAIWGVIGLMLAVAGFLTSPKLWLIVGMSAFYATFDSNEYIKPFLDILKLIGIGGGLEV